MNTAEPLVPEPRSFEIDVATEKLKSYIHLVLIKFRHNRFKKNVIHYFLRFTKLLVLF